MPPMMPFIHDALYLGFFAGLALFAWKVAQRYDLRLAHFDWRQTLTRAGDTAVPALCSWFTTTTAAARSSGNTAFDDWRDAEIAKIEAQRRTLETRLAAFQAFVDKLKRAKDRQTFDRFMAEHGEAQPPVDATDHRPA